MGKVQKKVNGGSSKSKWANAKEEEPQNAKERIEHELKLLHARKQAINTSKSVPAIHKVKKATTKKKVSVKKQKKLARALIVADKEEKKIETAKAKVEKRKLGKQPWN